MDKIEMLANYFGIEKSDLIEKHDSNEDETLKILNRNARKLSTTPSLIKNRNETLGSFLTKTYII